MEKPTIFFHLAVMIRGMGRGIAWLEEIVLCLLLLAMIFLACWQIVLRDVFSGGTVWINPLLRHLVLWAGLLGAVVATRRGKHISMDLASYLVPDQLKPWIGLACHVFSCLVSAVLTWAAVVFVRNEAMFGGPTLLSIPSWAWNLIFPLAFGLIFFHFLTWVVTDIVFLLSPIPLSSNPPAVEPDPAS